MFVSVKYCYYLYLIEWSIAIIYISYYENIFYNLYFFMWNIATIYICLCENIATILFVRVKYFYNLYFLCEIL